MKTGLGSLGWGILLIAAAQGVQGATAYRGTPQDFMEISQLFSTYNFTIDNHDGEAWADNFTSDGVFQDPSWCAIGREALDPVFMKNTRIGCRSVVMQPAYAVVWVGASGAHSSCAALRWY